MGTCRFILENFAQIGTVINGTAGPPTPPARSEAAPYVMERALNAHRRSLWKGGATNDILGYGGYQFDVDLVFGKTITAGALHGLSNNIIAADLYSLPSYPALPGSYDVVDAFTLNGRDGHILVPSLFKRYWSLVIVTASGAPTLGRLVLGTLVDLGVAPNPGSESSENQNRLEQVADDGSVTLLDLGYPGHDFILNFDPCSAAVRAKLRSVAAHPGPVTYIDPEERCFEVFVRRGRSGTSSVNTSMFSVSLEMSRLP